MSGHQLSGDVAGVRTRFFGIRGRTALGAVAVVGVALVVGAVLLVQGQRRALTRDIETAAVLRANDLAAALTEGTLPQGLLVQQPDEALVQVVDDTGRVVASTTNITGEKRIANVVAPASGHSATTTSAVPVGDSKFRVVAVRADVAGSSYTLYVAKSLEPVDNSVQNLIVLLALGLPPLLLLVGAVTWTVTGRTLRPVEAIRAEVETISTKDLHRRVPESAVRDEIGLLAQTMNTMLARLESATEREHRFVADASHELRSPLAAIKAQLEVDLAHPDSSDWQLSHTEVLDEIGRMQRLVDDLLVLARADHDTLVPNRRTVDLDDLVLEECRRVRARAAIVIDTTAVSGGQVDGDPELLARALRNLLDNAVRHAGSTVRVALREDATTVTLEVADDGPGIAMQDSVAIFERFARGDDARARADGGTGLGLAITREIINAHNGRIWVEDAAPGARFVVTLPASSAGRE
ncbi:MAG: ATP-binding protein [Acidimicrobiales bacterium]